MTLPSESGTVNSSYYFDEESTDPMPAKTVANALAVTGFIANRFCRYTLVNPQPSGEIPAGHLLKAFDLIPIVVNQHPSRFWRHLIIFVISLVYLSVEALGHKGVIHPDKAKDRLHQAYGIRFDIFIEKDTEVRKRFMPIRQLVGIQSPGANPAAIVVPHLFKADETLSQSLLTASPGPVGRPGAGGRIAKDRKNPYPWIMRLELVPG